MKSGQVKLGRDEGFAETQWIVMDGLQRLEEVFAQTAHGGWLVGERTRCGGGETCRSVTR